MPSGRGGDKVADRGALVNRHAPAGARLHSPAKGRIMLRIGVLAGDDIGLEVVPECVKAMRAAAALTGLDLEWLELPIGRRGHELYGHTFPEPTIAALERCDGWVLGPIGHAAYPRNDPTWIMPPIRKRFELYASIKPVRSYPNIASVHKDVDIVFVREVTEGMQSWDNVAAGMGEFRPNDEVTIAGRVITRRGSNRVAREAFEIARTRARRKLTAVHKEPVYRLACGMFAEECRKVAREYPDVSFEEAMIDTCAMKLVMKPQQYDVIVTTNQFGDILTDLGAGLVGGLGLAPGLCAGARQAMAQATHGSAPDIAGRGIANPYAMILSGAMLLEWLGRRRDEPRASAAWRAIADAVDAVIAEGQSLTPDLGGRASTAQMGDAIAARIAAGRPPAGG
jgi:3-isopropylmalate dehydrogenase